MRPFLDGGLEFVLNVKEASDINSTVQLNNPGKLGVFIHNIIHASLYIE
jgi:hypothetical protein